MAIVHRGTWSLILGLALSVQGGGSLHAQDRRTAAQFDVSLGALTVGIFWIDGSTTARAYTTSSGFRTSGIVARLTNVQVGLQARGRIRNGSLSPSEYREEVVLGRDRGTVQMRYTNGVPTVTGTKFGMEDAVAVDAAKQKGTLDPLSATFDLLRDQSRDELCDTDRFMFDGARRTRVVMTTLTPDGSDLLCTGQFLRLDGYSERDLRRSGVVDVSVRYRPFNGGMAAVEARFSSLRGTLRLTRR